MWFDDFLKNLGDLFTGLGQAVFRFYAETKVGTTKRLFFLNPIIANDLDTDGSGAPDLRIKILPHLAIPPDGLTVTFERLGGGTSGLSARVFIGIDAGIFPVGMPPPTMQFAFVGFDGVAGAPPAQELQIAFEQHTSSGGTHVALDVTTMKAPGPTVGLRAGLLTCHPSIEAAERIPGGGKTIRAANITTATQLTDARLGFSLPSGGSVTLSSPLHLVVDTAPSSTTLTYGAPEALALAADIEVLGPGYMHLLASTPLMPQALNVSISGTEAVVDPGSALLLDLRGVGLPAPLPGLTNATARLYLPGLPARIAWGPPPILVDIGPRPGTLGAFALAFNAELLAGTWTVHSLPSPPQPRQALVAEYDDGHDLWIAVNALSRLHVSRSVTSAKASLTLDGPRPSDVAPVPPRSIRITERNGKAFTADLRSSGLDPDDGNRGTVSGEVAFGTGSINAQLAGRLRHLRGVYDDGRSRTEAWTPVTPAKLNISASYGDRIEISVDPTSAISLNGDRVAYAGGGLGPFARLFARVLMNAPLHGHYEMTPRRGLSIDGTPWPPLRGTASAGSTSTVLLDSAGTDFTPDLVGRSLSYETGANASEGTRTITAVGVGRLTTDEFPFTPSSGDTFVVVSLDVLLDAHNGLPQPSTRRGMSATVSATRARDRRIATRIHPQVVRQATRQWNLIASGPGPDEFEAIGIRLEGFLRAEITPPFSVSNGLLELDLDPTRPHRSLRYADNRRWVLPEPIRSALAEQELLAPSARVLLADAPDTFHIQTAAGPGTQEFSLTRSGGGHNGWLWMVTEQSRHNGEFTGLGIVSLDIAALPRSISFTSADPLKDVQRYKYPNDIMWTPPATWLPPSSQSVTINGGDLRVERVVYASFWPGRLSRPPGTPSVSYPTRDQDQWDLTTVSFAHLHDASVPGQRITIWNLDQRDWDDPDRKSGIAVEAVGLNSDLDIDRFRALLTPGVRNYATIPWTKTTELQLQGYTGAWALSGGLGPDYERPNEDVGFWFLRAVDKIPGIGDAYFGNTSGNINGRQRLFP